MMVLFVVRKNDVSVINGMHKTGYFWAGDDHGNPHTQPGAATIYQGVSHH